MQKQLSEIAKEFWTSRKVYPPYPHRAERLRLDAAWVVDRFRKHGWRSFADLGCGDGALSTAIVATLGIHGIEPRWWAFDISDSMMDERLAKSPGFQTSDVFSEKFHPPKADVTLIFGTLIYAFDDLPVLRLVERLGKHVILRSPCTTRPESLLVCRDSEELGAKYAANYRTLLGTLSLFDPWYNVVEIQRAWPEELESKHEHRQWLALLEGRPE